MELKRGEVIMLPTNVVDYCCREGELIKHNSELFIADSDFRDPNNGCYTQQHLYITSDEEIKEGDWFIHNGIIEGDNRTVKTVQRCYDNTIGGTYYKRDCRKIIATTDETLYLPQPSQAFIEKYCKLGGIDEVNVEYEEIQLTTKEEYAKGKGFKYIKILKINSHNTIIIKSIKSSWTKEELDYNVMMAVSSFAAERGLTPLAKDMKVVNDWVHNYCKDL